MNCLLEFGKCSKISVNFPLDSDLIIKFTEWCYIHKKLKASTTRSYLSSISTALKMNNFDPTVCSNFITKQMLRGMENLEFYNHLCKKNQKSNDIAPFKISRKRIVQILLVKRLETSNLDYSHNSFFRILQTWRNFMLF